MSTTAKLAAFVASLAAVFAASFGVGSALGPDVDATPPAPAEEHRDTGSDHDPDH